MKHLKRFYENVNDELDIEYIKHCFADLSDDPECNVEYETHEDFLRDNPNNPYYDGVEYVDLSIDVPKLTKGGGSMKFEKMIENSERIALVVKSVDIAIKRLKDEYPSYNINVDYIEDDDKPNDYFQINITK
jgi:hypothetical protein